MFKVMKVMKLNRKMLVVTEVKISFKKEQFLLKDNNLANLPSARNLLFNFKQILAKQRLSK